jgi:hypothetical protein
MVGRAHLLDRDVGELGEAARGGVGAHVVFLGADLDVPEGMTTFCAFTALRTSEWRDALGLHEVLVHVDHDLARLCRRRDWAPPRPAR